MLSSLKGERVNMTAKGNQQVRKARTMVPTMKVVLNTRSVSSVTTYTHLLCLASSSLSCLLAVLATLLASLSAGSVVEAPPN